MAFARQLRGQGTQANGKGMVTLKTVGTLTILEWCITAGSADGGCQGVLVTRGSALALAPTQMSQIGPGCSCKQPILSLSGAIRIWGCDCVRRLPTCNEVIERLSGSNLPFSRVLDHYAGAAPEVRLSCLAQIAWPACVCQTARGMHVTPSCFDGLIDLDRPCSWSHYASREIRLHIGHRLRCALHVVGHSMRASHPRP